VTPAIGPDDFRRLCGHFATGVTIVTTIDPTGAPCGMTANSFASVSLEPPLISVAVDHTATIYPAMLHVPRFAVNVLDARQELLSRRFAEGLADRFDGVQWERSADDQVILAATLAHLCCNKWAAIPAGDHTIFIGLVTGGATAAHGRPLLHYRGGYADGDGTRI
jgi:3-hydroxy-9,10-secoandrosta-1,3,5(10)-triene-9,17-dione monooxygenase reductase component